MTSPQAPPLPVALFRALRPRQWVKNAVLLAGILFTLDHGHGAGDWLRVAAAIGVFCALSSAIYIVNDIVDRKQDREHPRKRHRPIAAGHVPLPLARMTALVLMLGGIGGALPLGPLFALCALAYVGLTLSYTAWLKHQVILDVMALSGCYVVRAVAGAVVIGVEISPWLLVCTTLGALLLGLAKRRNEILTLEGGGGNHRRILTEYSEPMLDQLIVIVTACTLMAYMLYTITSKTAQQRPLMILTTPFVVYGIFRFFYLVHRHKKGGDPSAELIEDRGLLVCGILWMLACVGVMLWGR